MIRSIRLRLLRGNLSHPPPLVPPFRRLGTSTSYACTPDIEAEEYDDREPYGNDYGAGPSSVPYTPRSTVSSLESAALRSVDQSGRVSARHRALDHVKRMLGTSDIDPVAIIAILDSPDRSVLKQFSKLETTTLISHMIETDQSLLAARLMLFYVDTIPRSPNSVGYIFKPQVISKVFRDATRPPKNISTNPAGSTRLAPWGTKDIDVLLPLLTTLIRIRHIREEAIYQCLLQRLCVEGLYDTAAKVYVELVEEWATEGRVAQGADPESFYEGGGPPRRGREEWELKSSLYKAWWKGIRTWALPGEVLSPHDRLDLWHPRKLRLPERLRQFPMPLPTSPPSIVPHPTLQNLVIILDHLELDPDVTTFEAFQRSMRACAILASTILSRTLPYLPARLLREVVGTAPNDPPVYPENTTVSPDAPDAWAYTAYTHIHLAFRSVLLSPPTVPSLFNYMVAYDEAKSSGKPVPALPKAYRYRTAPLNFSSCVYLTIYGLRKLKNADSVKNILEYARTAWGSYKIPHLYNSILGGMSALRENGLAKQVETILFGDSHLGPDAPPLSPVRSPRLAAREGNDAPRSLDAQWSIASPVDNTIAPNERSLLAVLSHMIATKQYDRFEDVVYRLIPYLQYNAKSDLSELEESTHFAEYLNKTGSRPLPNHLTPPIYTTVLRGLATMKSCNLARRIYDLALDAEKEWQRGYLPGNVIADDDRLRIDTFTAMIEIWDAESRYRQRLHDANLVPDAVASEWVAPMGKEGLPRHIAASLATWDVYLAARTRWRTAAFDPTINRRIFDKSRVGAIAPDPAFFNAIIIARAEQWGLRNGNDWSVGLTQPPCPGAERHGSQQPREVREMRTILKDVTNWGFDVPPALEIRVGVRTPMKEHDVATMRATEITRMAKVKVEEGKWAQRGDERISADLEYEMKRIEAEKRQEDVVKV